MLMMAKRLLARHGILKTGSSGVDLLRLGVLSGSDGGGGSSHQSKVPTAASRRRDEWLGFGWNRVIFIVGDIGRVSRHATLAHFLVFARVVGAYTLRWRLLLMLALHRAVRCWEVWQRRWRRHRFVEMHVSIKMTEPRHDYGLQAACCLEREPGDAARARIRLLTCRA